MQLQDLQIFSPQHLQTLRDITRNSKPPLTLDTLLQQLKSTVKDSPELRDHLQHFVSFFMYCQSKYKPSSEQWEKKIEQEMRAVEKVIRAKGWWQRRLMGRVWRALGKGKELGRSVVGGLGERVRTVVTEVMSRSMNHLVQRSDKTLGPIEPVMEVKWTNKLKSRAFFAWLKFISHHKQKKQLKDKQIVDIKRANDYHNVSLKVKSLYSCKQFLILQRAEKYRINILKESALYNLKNQHFQKLVDAYTITKIQAMLEKKVSNLVNNQNKIRALRRLRQNAAIIKKSTNFNNYFCVIFLRILIQTYCNRQFCYEENRLATTLDACSKTDKANLKNQLTLFSKLLIKKSFSALKIRAKSIVAFRKKTSKRWLSKMFQTYKSGIKYMKNQNQKIQTIKSISKKYDFRFCLASICKVPARTKKTKQFYQKAQKAICPLFIKSFFHFFKKRTIVNLKTQAIFSERTKNVLLKRNFNKMINNIQESSNETHKLLDLQNTITKLRKRQVLRALQYQKVKTIAETGLNNAADSLRLNSLMRKVWTEWVSEVQCKRILNAKMRGMVQILNWGRKDRAMKVWMDRNRVKKQNLGKISLFQMKGLKKYFNKITDFIVIQRNRIAGMVEKRKIVVQKIIFSNLLKYVQNQKKYAKTLNKLANKNLMKRVFNGIKKNNEVGRKQQRLTSQIFKKQVLNAFKLMKQNYSEYSRQNNLFFQIAYKSASNRFIENLKQLVFCNEPFHDLATFLLHTRIKQSFQLFKINSKDKIDLNNRISKLRNKISLNLTKRYIKKVSEQCAQRKLEKSLKGVVRKRHNYTVKSIVKNIKKVVLKLCRCKANQKKLKVILRGKAFRILLKRLSYIARLKRNEQQRIAPVTHSKNMKIYSAVFERIRSQVSRKKAVAITLFGNLESALARTYSSVLINIFDEFSFKSRQIAATLSHKKRCVKRLVQATVQRSNQKFLEFKAIKHYAQSIQRKAMNSLIINNQNQENTIIFPENISKWKTRLDNIGTHCPSFSRPPSSRKRSQSIALPPKRNSFLR